MPDHDVDSNKLLRDRDGGLWIGTHQRGLIHVFHGRTDVFRKSDGLTGDIIAGIFEDREGNIWVSTSGGLDRFRELPVTNISATQGLSSDHTDSILAATDGSVWIATHDGLTRWKNGQLTIFRKSSGLPDDVAQSLYEDDRGRMWVFTNHGLAYFKGGRFVAINGVASKEVYSITGDKAGNLWLSGNQGLSHLLEGRLVEHFPWSVLGRSQQAKVIVADQGGVWLSFWNDGGVLYFKDGKVRASYTAADGLGKGHVPGLRLDRDGAVWAGTEEGGLSRIKDGRIATLTTKNGLPCDTIHWTIEDDDRSLWLYTACGLVRIARTELDAWTADPKRMVETAVWDAADGVSLHAISPNPFGPPVAKSTDGKLWLVPGAGVQVIDPRHLAVNKLQPPIHIEQVRADGKPYQIKQGMRLSRQRPGRVDRLHGTEPGSAGEGPFQIYAGGAGPGLEGSHQRPPGAVFESAASQVPLPGNRLQQQRTVERDRRRAGILHRSGVLPEEWISRPLRGCFSRTPVDGLPVPSAATAVAVQQNHRSARE